MKEQYTEAISSSVFRGGHAAMPPPRKVRKHFLTRYTVKNGISNLYILLKSALKMQEMPFQRPKFQKIFGGTCPRTPLKLCRHYGLPLTKILATPLAISIYPSIHQGWRIGILIAPILIILDDVIVGPLRV